MKMASCTLPTVEKTPLDVDPGPVCGVHCKNHFATNAGQNHNQDGITFQTPQPAVNDPRCFLPKINTLVKRCAVSRHVSHAFTLQDRARF